MNLEIPFCIDSRQATIYDCSLFHLPRLENESGNITTIENLRNVPFEVRRVYYLYDIPGGESRGGHAHKTLQQMVIAAGGSFDVLVDDGRNKRVVSLNRPYLGLLIVPGLWREVLNFSSGAVCLVLASEPYDETDYLRDYLTYRKFKNV